MANPKQVLFVWIAIISRGWGALKNLPHFLDFEAAVAWLFFVGFL